MAVQGYDKAKTDTLLSAKADASALDDYAKTADVPDSPGDIGAATAAQGALADSAVQPADLDPYAKTADVHSVPSGGATGQVLAKASGSDYDTEWATPSSSGGGSGNGVTLQADPIIITPGMGRSGSFVSIMGNTTPSDITRPFDPALHAAAAPVVIPASITVDSISVKVTTAGDAGATIRFGLATCDDTGAIGATVLDSGALTCDTTGVLTATITPTTLDAGLYVVLALTTSSTVRVTGWAYPDWRLATGINDPTAAFTSQFGVWASGSTTWQTDWTGQTFNRNNSNNAGVPVVQAHVTEVG